MAQRQHVWLQFRKLRVQFTSGSKLCFKQIRRMNSVNSSRIRVYLNSIHFCQQHNLNFRFLKSTSRFRRVGCWKPRCDPDVIWTRNLLNWSQTRYRCATRPDLILGLIVVNTVDYWVFMKIWSGPTEIWTRIAGFRVLSANHYTIGPDAHCKIEIFCFSEA